MMKSVLTASGAVIHVDANSPFQNQMLNIALTAFGGQIGEAVEIEENAA